MRCCHCASVTHLGAEMIIEELDFIELTDADYKELPQ
jgi:hypothetical protein